MVLRNDARPPGDFRSLARWSMVLSVVLIRDLTSVGNFESETWRCSSPAAPLSTPGISGMG